MGLFAHYLEQAGFVTIGLSNLPQRTAKLRPPRTLITAFPRGETAGPANDRKTQRQIVLQALSLYQAETPPAVLEASTPA